MCTARRSCSTPASRSRSWALLSAVPPWAVKRTVAAARKADREVLERALEALAEFELESRGGGDRDLDEDTAFTMTLASAARR